jgi:hypothetical protein
MAVRGMTFTKGGVLTLIDQMNRPTIMDDEHGADWWNENFGRIILFSFSEAIKRVKTSVEFMDDCTVTNVLSIINQANAGLSLITTKDYPPAWWQTEFGLKIRQSFSEEFRRLQEDILTMRGK